MDKHVHKPLCANLISRQFQPFPTLRWILTTCYQLHASSEKSFIPLEVILSKKDEWGTKTETKPATVTSTRCYKVRYKHRTKVLNLSQGIKYSKLPCQNIKCHRLCFLSHNQPMIKEHRLIKTSCKKSTDWLFLSSCHKSGLSFLIAIG